MTSLFSQIQQHLHICDFKANNNLSVFNPLKVIYYLITLKKYKYQWFIHMWVALTKNIFVQGIDLRHAEIIKAVASEKDVPSKELAMCHMMILEDVSKLSPIDR